MALTAGPILPGPRKPTWGCPSCGASANWASRIKCRCGQDAPAFIVQRARKAAKEAMQQPASGPPRRVGGGGSHGPPTPAPWSDQYKQMQKQMEYLSAELKRVKAEKGGAAKPDGVDAQSKDSNGNETDYAKRAALQKRIDVLDQFIKQTKELDEDDPDLPAAKKKLDLLREEHRAMRPPVSAHKAAFQKLERCKSQKTKMENEVSELSARLQSLQNELDGKRAALEAKSKEVDLLEVEVETSAAKLRKQRGPKGAEAAGVPEDFIKQLGSNPIFSEDAELDRFFKDLSMHPKFEKFQKVVFESVSPAVTVDDPMAGMPPAGSGPPPPAGGPAVGSGGEKRPPPEIELSESEAGELWTKLQQESEAERPAKLAEMVNELQKKKVRRVGDDQENL